MSEPMAAMMLASLRQRELMEQAAYARLIAEARRGRVRRRPWWRPLMLRTSATTGRARTAWA